MIYLCLGLLTVAMTVSASLDPNGKDSVEKYTLKLSKDGKDYDGEVDMDTNKRTDIFHVPKGSSDEEAGDVAYDLKSGDVDHETPGEAEDDMQTSHDEKLPAKREKRFWGGRRRRAIRVRIPTPRIRVPKIRVRRIPNIPTRKWICRNVCIASKRICNWVLG